MQNMDRNNGTSINIKVVKEEEFDRYFYRWELRKKLFRDACIEEARKPQPKKLSPDFVQSLWTSKLEPCEADGGRNCLNFSDIWVPKDKLIDLYEEYEPLHRIKIMRFRDPVDPPSFAEEYYADYRSLKIETWYFLTPIDATKHLLFDKYLESCSFVKRGSYSDSDVENLQKLVSLPKELIVSGIKRKARQYKVLEIEREVAMVMKYLVENDCIVFIQGSKNPFEFFPSLKKDLDLRHVSDDRLKHCLHRYICLLDDVPRRSLADYRKFFEHDLLQQIDDEYEWLCQEYKQSWMITENDGLVYYNAFKNLYWKQEKVEHLKHMMVQRIDDFFGSLSETEGIMQHFKCMMKEIENHRSKCSPPGIKQLWNTWEVHGPSFYTASKNSYWEHGKLEIWYFLTEEEKKQLLRFEKYIKSSPDPDCSPETIENLAQCFFLPKDLIMAGIERKINLSKMIERKRDVYEVVHFFLKNGPALRDCSLPELLEELKKESRFSIFDDGIFREALKVYDSSDTWTWAFSPNYGEETDLGIQVKTACEDHCKRIKRSWKFDDDDEFCYGKFSNRTPETHEIMESWKMDVDGEFCYGKFSNRTPETLEIMEDSIMKDTCKQCGWGSEDSRLSKRCRTSVDYLDEHSVDEASLFEIDARQKDIGTLYWHILSGFQELARGLSEFLPICASLSAESLK